MSGASGTSRNRRAALEAPDAERARSRRAPWLREQILESRLGPLWFRLWEWRRAWRSSATEPAVETGPDGWPLPPPLRITAVAGGPSQTSYIETGARDAARMAHVLEAAGVVREGSERILDFGCGCARLTRHLAGWTKADVYGTDRSAAAIRWCRGRLPFGHFERNDSRPPLHYEEASIDLAVAWSVFTHLDAELAAAWLTDLHRVLAPGGHLLLTSHGSAYRSELTRTERARFDVGEIVVRRRRAAGSNLCAAFHPGAAMRRQLAPLFRVLAHDEASGQDAAEQDLWLVVRDPSP
jgi:SAM-dependent methyltransferase